MAGSDNWRPPTWALQRSAERTGTRWCSDWRQHPEALLHMDLLFADWNECRRTPALGIGSFLRRSLDYSLPILTGPTGPFAACRPGRHEPPTFLGS